MFTADKVVFEFTADTKNLDRAFVAATNDARKQGRKAGDSYEAGFDGETVGRGLTASIAAGVRRSGSVLKTALTATTALATAGLALGAGFVATARSAIGAAADMKVLADTAGVSAERFQELRFAASQYGIEQDKISDILKDVNDKFGDFNATGAGPLADFFENVAPKVGVLAEDFRDLSSDQALGLYVDTLQRAGANSQDFAFYMEALASDATTLIPLFKDNAAELGEFSEQARNAGGFLSNEVVQGAQDADQKFNELAITLRDGLTAKIVELAPEIEALTQQVLDLIPQIIEWAGVGIKALGGLGDAYRDLFNIRNTDPNNARDSLTAAAENEGLADMLRAMGETNKSILQNGFLREGVYEQLGKTEVDAILARGGTIEQGLRDEAARLRSVAEELALKELAADLKAREDAEKARNERANSRPPGVGARGISGGGAERIAEDTKEAQKRLAEAQKLREANLTAEEQYQAELADIRVIETDPMLLAAAGGEETIMRARVAALVDLAAASDDVGAAHIALAAAIENGTLTTDAALEASTKLNAEFGIFTKAEIEARAVVEEKNEALQKQIEYQLELAEISGNNDEATRLTRELEVLRRKGDLLRENVELTEQEAQARAQSEVDRLSRAQDLAGFDDLDANTSNGENRLQAELARIDEVEQAKIERLESYRTAETEKLRDFEALKTDIVQEADLERAELKAQALDDQLALAENVFGGISDLLRAAGKEDSKTAKAAAQVEKGIALARATVNTALGVSKALASAPPPVNFVNAALVGAAGAVQIATIASSFKDGVISLKGPGTSRSDDIPAMLSRGESVLTARATRGNELGLERLNAGMSPREAFGLGRGYMDGIISVGMPMAKAPDITAPDTSAFSDMAANAAPMYGGDTHYYDLQGVDTAQIIAFIESKQRETEAKVPTLVASDDTKRKRARPK